MPQGPASDVAKYPGGRDLAHVGEDVPQLASDVELVVLRETIPDGAELRALFEFHDQEKPVALAIHGVESRRRNGGVLGEQQEGMAFVFRYPGRHAILDDELSPDEGNPLVAVVGDDAREGLVGCNNLVQGRERIRQLARIAEKGERWRGDGRHDDGVQSCAR